STPRSMPRSMPVSCPVGGSGWDGTSAQETSQPSASRPIVTVLGTPSIGHALDWARPRLGTPSIGHALQRAAPAHRNAPTRGEGQRAVLQPCAVADLLVGEGMPAVAAVLAWKARLLALLHAAKERLIGLVEARQPLWQEVGVDGVRWERLTAV